MEAAFAEPLRSALSDALYKKAADADKATVQQQLQQLGTEASFFIFLLS